MLHWPLEGSYYALYEILGNAVLRISRAVEAGGS
jgi:hypothetical protein